MITKLRRKIIAIAMCSIGLVLFIIILGINIANYLNVCKNADMRIHLIANNGGQLPQNSKTENGIIRARPQGPDSSGKPKDERRILSPEAAFDTRFFTVTLLPNGQIKQIDTCKIAAISNDDASQYAQALYEKQKGSGFIDCYRYQAINMESGATMYIFVNSERELNTFHTFQIASISISLAGLLVVFLLVVFFSRIMVKPIAESYQKQKRFITDASHEIKTPLTIIDANTEVLEMTEGENQWTKSTRKQIARLTSLTEKLVFLSRMDEASIPVEMLEFTISDAIIDTAEPFVPLAAACSKTLTLNIEPELIYYGNEGMIRQLVSLLLDNAIKYSNENGEISLLFRSHAKGCQLIIQNTVDYIKPGRHDELFERFYRPDSSRSKETGGFGIGLSVAYAIVNTHKGKISAKSDDGKSITFFVRL